MASLKKTALIITIISLISKVFGFGREVALAYFFGTSSIVDSYLMAIAIPTIIFGWLSSLSVVYIPIYTDLKANYGIKKSNEFSDNVISVSIVLSIICALLGMMFSKSIVSIVSPGFEGATYDMTVQFLNISIWSILFTSVLQILISYLNCNDKFIQSNISSLFFSSIQIVFIIISGIISSKMLVYGYLAANISYFAILLFFSFKNNFSYRFKISFTKELKQAFSILIPVFFSSMIMQINVLIDKTFASVLQEGSISALNYASVLKGFIIVIFMIAINTMIYPMLSKAFAEKNIIKFKDIFSKGTNIIIILFVPITVGAIILSKPAISFIFERGEFGNTSVIMTTSAFIMYTVGVLAISLRDVITKVFYSMQDTKSMLYISALALALDIIFNILLIKPMGHAGLALGTSLSAIITIPIFFIVLRKKLGALGLKNTMILFVKSCVSTVVMGIVVYFGFSLLSDALGSGKLSTLLSIILSAGIGGTIYFILMIILKVKEMDFFTDIIKKVGYKLAIKR